MLDMLCLLMRNLYFIVFYFISTVSFFNIWQMLIFISKNNIKIDIHNPFCLLVFVVYCLFYNFYFILILSFNYQHFTSFQWQDLRLITTLICSTLVTRHVVCSVQVQGKLMKKWVVAAAAFCWLNLWTRWDKS